MEAGYHCKNIEGVVSYNGIKIRVQKKSDLAAIEREIEEGEKEEVGPNLIL